METTPARSAGTRVRIGFILPVATSSRCIRRGHSRVNTLGRDRLWLAAGFIHHKGATRPAWFACVEHNSPPIGKKMCPALDMPEARQRNFTRLARSDG